MSVNVTRESQALEVSSHELRQKEATAVNEALQAGQLRQFLGKRTICIEGIMIARQLNIQLLDLREVNLQHVRKLEEVLLAGNLDTAQVASCIRANQAGDADHSVLENKFLQLALIL